MFHQSIKNVFIAVMVICLAFGASAQTKIVVNNVGYEKTGVKRAILMMKGAPAGGGCSITYAHIINAAGNVVDSIPIVGCSDRGGGASAQWNVDGYNYFEPLDFTHFRQTGDGYRIRMGTLTSPAFSVGEKLLQTKTGADQVNFFNKMRNTDEGDAALPIFGSSATHNIYGGWWDATGDPGKHLSHLAYSNYFTPQQIPMVVWALLHAAEAQPSTFGTAAKSEAAWGADYLLRSLASGGYFYMSVFDNWGDGHRWTEQPSGSKAEREICAWGNLTGLSPNTDHAGNIVDGTFNSDGVRSGDYQSAMREGAGVSIAALARAAKANISGDSSAAQYLAGAKRAYAHLKDNPTKYQDNSRQNIIDYYTGLLAASELYRATSDAEYLTDAHEWAGKLMSLQSDDGWFYSDKDNAGQNIRPFYHAAEEGFPVVALTRYYQVAGPTADKAKIRGAVGKNLRWYRNITYTKGGNPFEYAKMWRAKSESLGGDPPDEIGGKYIVKKEAEDFSEKEGDFRVTPEAGRTVIGHIENGNTATYSVNVDHADRYTVEFTIASALDIDFGVTVNGTNAGSVTSVSTGGWESYKTASVKAQLKSGSNTIKLNFKGAVNIDFFRLVSDNVEIEAPPQSDQGAYFFIPKVNETGYWWQGENARLASLASAFIMGAPLADPTGEMWADTLFGMATAQLDWILGRNPFDLCMMYGYGDGTKYGDGDQNYPDYPATQHLPNIKGGICNGISSARANESDIEWMPYDGDNFWRNWRFVEQWLPHNAWYLVAVSSLSYRMDVPITEDPISVKYTGRAKSARMKVTASRGRNIRIELPFAADKNTSVIIYDMRGRKIFSHGIKENARALSMKVPANIARGMYVLSVRDASGKNKVSDRIHLR